MPLPEGFSPQNALFKLFYFLSYFQPENLISVPKSFVF